MGLIIPKNNADANTIDATLQVYYDAEGWVTNEELINKLSALLLEKKIEESKKEPQSYTKKTQVPAYFGFIEWEDPRNSQSRRRITESGRLFYEARKAGNTKYVLRILMEALRKCTFGRNVVGCNSDSDIEAPNVFIKASLIFGKLSYVEFAYILGLMENEGLEFGDAICKLKICKLKGSPIQLNPNTEKWKDPKPIIALTKWGFLNSGDGSVNKEVIDEFSDQLSDLRTKNTDTVKFVSDKDLSDTEDSDDDNSRQQIFYGAPGTGKSFGIDDHTDGEIIRTTFHPDSDYSTFVGAYKPTVEKTKKLKTDSYTIDGNEREEVDAITYKFVGQAFFKSYIKAWENKLKGTDEKVYLVIEEINRGNCAQIFGDLFQLLDRDENGNSCYPIVPDEDLGTEISNVLMQKSYDVNLTDNIAKDCTYREIREGSKLLLPNNLYIWATMNTSDQSLFPIDSAFKRRWDWVYIPIEIPKEEVFRNREIVVNEEYSVNWGEFMNAINKRIYKATNSEDKQLGFFFCRPKKKNAPIDVKTFVGKVVFYLWQDVFKMTSSTKSVFNFGGRMHTFPEFYKGKETINTELVQEFIQSIMGDSNKTQEQA